MIKKYEIAHSAVQLAPTTNTSDVPTKANQLANFPLNFLRTGYYSGGNVRSRTTNGIWWPSTSKSATNAYFLTTDTTIVYPQWNDNRGNGFALRCSLGKYGLPTTNTQNVAAKANQLANFPLNFLRTGFYNYSSGGMNNRMTWGFWWSTTSKDATFTKALYIDTARIDPQNSVDRGYGFAPRCARGTQKTTPTFGKD